MAPSPEPSTAVRRATPGDVPLLLDLIRALARYEKLEDRVVATPELLRAAIFGDRPSCEALIGELGGKPVGFAIFFRSFSTFLGRAGLYLEDIFVVPESRGHGVGRALLQHLAAIAVHEGCGRFEWSVLDWNEPAIRFYESLGATPMKEWTVYRLEGAVLEALARGGRPV